MFRFKKSDWFIIFLIAISLVWYIVSENFGDHGGNENSVKTLKDIK